MTQFSIVSSLIFALCIGQGVLAQYNQRVVLHSGTKCTGSFVTVTETYIQDLRTLGWDNYAYSASVTGVWNFYDYVNFNQGSDATMEYAFGPMNYCIDFNNLRGRATSMRFAGSPKDYRSNTLTLFRGTYFQEDEEYIITSTPNLQLQLHSSFIITGASAWTLYDRPNYAGNSICVHPPDSSYTPAFIYDTMNVNVPHSTIRSVRIGCVGKKIVRAPIDPRGAFTPLSVEGEKTTA